MHRIIKTVRSVPVALLASMILTGLISFCWASAAQACEYQPLEWSELYPPVGTNFTEGESESQPWGMVAQPGLGYTTVHIASGPLLGSDGRTLSDLDRVDSFTLYESHTNEGVYLSVTGPHNWNRPGTYYWQMEATKYPPYPSPCIEYQSAISSFVVTPKPAPPPAAPQPAPPPPAASAPPIMLALAESYSDVKDIISARSGHNAHHLKAKCRNTSRSQAKCIASWFTALHVSPSASVYSGDFYIDKRGEGDFFTFVGIKANVGCTERHTLKHCESKVHWQTVT